jgi:hypothetical protein
MATAEERDAERKRSTEEREAERKRATQKAIDHDARIKRIGSYSVIC